MNIRIFILFSLFFILYNSGREASAQEYWIRLNSPTQKDLNKLAFVDSLNGWIVGDSGTILRTTNGGNVWIKQNSQVGYDILDISMVNHRVGWALALDVPSDASSQFGTVFLHTTNGGEVWTQRRFPGEDEFFYSILFLDTLRGWIAGEFGKIMQTHDGGLNWQQSHVDSSLFSQWEIRRIEFYNEETAYAMGGRMDIIGVVWQLLSGGERWRALGIAPEPVLDLHMIDSLNFLGITGDIDFGSGLVRTSDAGESWVYEYLGIFGEARALSFRTGAEAWSPLGFAGKYMYTLDSGQTWSSMFSPDTIGMFDVQFVDSRTGFMVGNQGRILKYNAELLGFDDRINSHLPSSVHVEQNYPNPFNPATTIRYQLPERRSVRLLIYDLLGRVVREMDEGVREAGEYTRSFDGGGLASGTYFYRVVSRSGANVPDQFSSVKKMVLIR